jgi:hypothetical protein
MYVMKTMYEILELGWTQWLIPITLVTQEVEIGRIVVPGQLGQKVSKTPS